MRKRRSSQTLLSFGVILCCAMFAYYAQINGLTDEAIATGATVISAVLLGLFWRRSSKERRD